MDYRRLGKVAMTALAVVYVAILVAVVIGMSVILVSLLSVTD